ncbi:MAG: prepilin-type N-terminal cleavage/methylation domain-containing protein [Polyangiaceae bacterium]|nr:prepilin-type N-terminal cleavage/methylation domain-containing protein [Polyangiaceae bacterium]
MRLTPLPRNRLRSYDRSRAGFTLIEIMIVVSVVALMAALAAPSIIRIVQDRKSQKDALSLLGMLQDAHTRAFGRGAAVLVTYTEGGANPDRINFRESMLNVDNVGTLDIPNPSCSGTPSAVVRFWNPTDRERGTNITMNMNGQAGSFVVGASQELCFTPRGGTRGKTVVPPIQWVNLNDAIQFTVRANDTGNDRFVYLYPNGISRLRI